jgi:hypothetical protein
VIDFIVFFSVCLSSSGQAQPADQPGGAGFALFFIVQNPVGPVQGLAFIILLRHKIENLMQVVDNAFQFAQIRYPQVPALVQASEHCLKFVVCFQHFDALFCGDFHGSVSFSG